MKGLYYEVYMKSIWFSVAESTKRPISTTHQEDSDTFISDANAVKRGSDPRMSEADAASEGENVLALPVAPTLGEFWSASTLKERLRKRL